jgi:hypothetical protein
MDATHFCSACKAKVVYRTSSGPVEIQVPGPKVHPDSKAQYAAPQDMQKPMATGPPAPPYTIEPAPAVIQTQPVEKQPVVSPELAVSK